MKSKSFIALVLLAITACRAPKAPTDAQIRQSVVKLQNDTGACSGTQIEAPSGKKYILTAAHCLGIAKDGIMPVQTEDGGSYFSRVLEEDDKADLLLLEPAPGVPAVKVANDVHRQEHLKSFTHGHAYPTYSTEGVYIGEDVVQFAMGVIDSDAARAACSKSKNKIEHMTFLGADLGEICTVKVVESVTTVKLVPGSSGGLIANDKGEMIGVCSAGDQDFNYIVTLKDIQRFLEKR